MSSRSHGVENEDDAMFTKKPLGGMSCASCEKNIVNLHGHKADYLPWNRFPFRDPSERIAKVRWQLHLNFALSLGRTGLL